MHLAGELLKSLAGIDMTHIPYTGSAPAVRDTIAGHVDFTFTGGGMTYADAGQVKALGVTSAKRTTAAPQVPAIAEFVPGYDANVWFGFLVPAGTSKAHHRPARARDEEGDRTPARSASGSRPPRPRSNWSAARRRNSAPTSRGRCRAGATIIKAANIQPD